MSDPRYLTAIVTCQDTQADLRRLLEALKRLPVSGNAVPMDTETAPAPVIRQSIRSALFGPVEPVPLELATGRIAAQFAAPYPPGTPVIAPGEEITEKHIAYLQKKRYNVSGEISVIP